MIRLLIAIALTAAACATTQQQPAGPESCEAVFDAYDKARKAAGDTFVAAEQPAPAVVVGIYRSADNSVTRAFAIVLPGGATPRAELGFRYHKPCAVDEEGNLAHTYTFEARRPGETASLYRQ